MSNIANLSSAILLTVKMPESFYIPRVNREQRIIRNWLESILEDTGMTATALARKAGLTPSTLTKFLNSPVKHTLSVPTITAVANAVGKKVPFLLDGNTTGTDTVPVVGYVGGGGAVYPIDDHPKGFGLTEVEAPPSGELDLVAVIVDGNSMYPLYHDGDILYYRRDFIGINEAQCLNRPCVVQIHEGPTLVKIVQRGTRAKHYNLISLTEPPRENQRLDWAVKVLWVRHK